MRDEITDLSMIRLYVVVPRLLDRVEFSPIGLVSTPVKAPIGPWDFIRSLCNDIALLSSNRSAYLSARLRRTQSSGLRVKHPIFVPCRSVKSIPKKQLNETVYRFAQ